MAHNGIDRYGVMGFPVSHSRSPIIHRLFALQTGQELQYELLQVAPDKLGSSVRQFQSTGGKGLNITLPHKTEVLRLVDDMSESARSAGALNTLSFNADGSVKANDVFVKEAGLPCVDGIFYDAKRDIIYVTDSELNAIHAVTPEGKRTVIWENGDTDGADGSLDQPCEPIVRGDELIVVSFDYPFPGLKNTLHDEHHTLSVIQLKK